MESTLFAKRRQAFYGSLGRGIAVLYAAPHATRNSDNHYEFRTCSNFYYLTGVKEQEAAAIFVPGSEKPFRLFVLPKDPLAELWEGKRIGVDGAKSRFGADEVYPISEFETVLKKVLAQTDTLYFPLGDFPAWDAKILEIVRNHHPYPRRGEKEFRGVQKVQPLIAEMRKKKDGDEIEIMRRNAENSSLAHRKAMELTRPGLNEYDIEAEIEYWFRRGGAEDLAYPSIVAGGSNATVLHYKTNREKLREGSLLLIDAGGEMGLYASDITRTFPVSGKFSRAQREIYEIVLAANKAAIQAVRPGIRFTRVHEIAVEKLVEGLVALGFLKGNVKEIASDKTRYSAFYPHSTSHWLGLDVHDPGAYVTSAGESVPLETGNVLTVEPGLYIPEDRMDVPEEYRGIGIRIEDDVLVTEGGFDVLTKNCPKEIAEIESIVGTGAR